MSSPYDEHLITASGWPCLLCKPPAQSWHMTMGHCQWYLYPAATALDGMQAAGR